MSTAPRLIYVAGMPSGGTSMVAGMLHGLGVNMGRFMSKELCETMQTKRSYQTFECLEWANMVTNFRTNRPSATLDEITQVFQQYVKHRLGNGEEKKPQGIKQPTLNPIGLSYRLDDIPLTLVHVHRDLEDCFRSRVKYEGNDTDDARDMGVMWLGLYRMLQRVKPVVSLTFDEVNGDPRSAATKLSKALDLPADRIEKAASIVKRGDD